MKKQVFHAPKFWAAFAMVVCALCTAQAQDPLASPIHWQFTSPSTHNDPDANGQVTNGEDWIYNLIQAKDGSIIAAGYSESYHGSDRNRPTLFKYFNNKKQILWEYNGATASTCTNPLLDKGGIGNLQDVVEAEGAYYAVGWTRETEPLLCRDAIVVVKIEATTGENQTIGTPVEKRFKAANAAGFKQTSRAYSIRPVFTSGALSGFIIAGHTGNQAFLMKLTKDLDLDPNFGPIVNGAPTGCVFFELGTFASNAIAVSDGYIFIGDIVQASDRDVYVTKTNLNGVIQSGWPRTFNETVIAPFGYVPNTANPSCSAVANPTNEHGVNVEELADGYILSTQFRKIQEFGGSHCGVNDGYLQADATLIKIQKSTGNAR